MGASGPIVADRFHGIELSLIRQINALATPLSINLGIGEPNLEPDATLKEMARAAATDSWKYTANAGTPSLRRLIAGSVQTDAEVCVTAGTEEALYAIFQAFVNPGDEVLVPNPGFVAYETLARIAGATVVTYELEAPEWRLDTAAVTSRLTSRTKLIIVNSPSNPLGAVADHESLRAIAAAAEERHCLVVSDEIYGRIWYDQPPASMLGLGRNVIVVDGMSKSHGMTGLRIGWTIAHADIIKPIVTAHQYIATCASAFSQALAERVLSNPVWNESWLAEVREQFLRQRNAALHAIARELQVPVEAPPAAFYIFAPVPSCDTLSFARTLATDAAVLVIPGTAFGSNGEGFVRISYAAPIESITAGIERIGVWLRGNGR